MPLVKKAHFGKDSEALLARLMAKVNVDAASGCWNWTGACSKGYGLMSKARGKSPFKTHRLSYELLVGAIPSGQVLRHTCDNPRCCNPEHLTPGTQGDNMKDASVRGRLNPASRLNLRPGAKGVRGAATPITENNRAITQ